MNQKTTTRKSSNWRLVKQWFGRLARLFNLFLFPFMLAVVFAVVFAVPDQFIELYRIMAGDVAFAQGGGGWFDTAFSFMPLLVPLVVLAAFLTLASRILEILGRGSQGVRVQSWRIAYDLAPILIGILPIAGCVAGLFFARPSWVKKDIAGEAQLLLELGDRTLARTHLKYVDFADRLDEILLTVAISSIVIGAVFAIAAASIYRRTNTSPNIYLLIRNPLVPIAFAGVIVAVIFAVLRFPVALPRALGVFGIIAAFGSLLALFGSMLIVQSRRYGPPFITILAIAAVAFTILDLNDNHQLRYSKNSADYYPSADEIDETAALPEVEDDFLSWLKTRQGITFTKPDDGNGKGTWKTESGKNFPVYIVAAQGGGIYAATQTNVFLTQTTATCENFAQHLFAISSVSGGSVGAAAFSASLTKFGRKDADCVPFEKIIKPSRDSLTPEALSALRAAYSIAEEDWLSPLIGAGLFPDFAQRFLFWRMPSWSRARALEAAFEESWQRLYLKDGETGSPLVKGTLASWDPAGIRPAILFNTTEAATGRRRVIAPFRFNVANSSDLRFMPLSKELDISLSAAAAASARFPYVTPAAWFWPNKKQNRVRIVDGGYFENSGVATASDLIARLSQIKEAHNLPVEFHLIVLTYGRYPERKFYAFGELLAPVRSLLNTRESRTLSTIALADRDLGTITDAAPVRRLQRVTLTDFYTPLPLGWRLSKIGVLQIRRGMSRLPYCYPDGSFVQNANVPALGNGNCVARLVWHQLRGDDILEALESTCKQAEKRAKDAGGTFKCADEIRNNANRPRRAE